MSMCNDDINLCCGSSGMTQLNEASNNDLSKLETWKQINLECC